MIKFKEINDKLGTGSEKALKALRSLRALIALTALMMLPCVGIASVFPAGEKKNSYIDVTVDNIYIDNPELPAPNLNVALTYDLSNVNLKGNSELVVTPMLVDNNGHEAELESFTVAGRNRYYWLERNNKVPEILAKGWGKDKGVKVVNGVKGFNAVQPEKLNGLGSFNALYTLPYKNWMNDATLVLKAQDLGCANCRKGENDYPLAQTEYVQETYDEAEFIYVTPVAEAVKMREISARAYIDFVVNRTEINPDYRRNPVELAKIRATIDSVRNDKDITVKKLHIFGTASPEGSYQNNVRLAKGRTESLKDYVQNLYRFPSGVLTTSYEPVDWEGLAQFLRQVLGMSDEGLGKDSIRQDQFAANNQFVTTPNTQSSNTQYLSELPHAREILGIVTGDLEPFARNSKIKSTYPKEYAWLLANVYPALRHSDYRIEFEIKTYTEVSEILEVMQTQPSKLSLAELFVAANSQPEGSELYNRAFELAVTMYPADETANLNAGIAAMKRGDFVMAQRYLANAGNTSEAEYARAVMAFEQEDYETARQMLKVLQYSTNPQVADQASTMLRNMEEVDSANGFRFRLIP